MHTKTSNGNTKRKNPKILALHTRLHMIIMCCLIAMVVAASMTVWFYHALSPAVAGHDDSYETYQQIMVQPGDTLWTISARLAQGTDQAEILEKILAYNDLETSDLEVGQILYVPVIPDASSGT